MPASDVYPQSSRERDRWIVALRPQGNAALDPHRAYAAIAEQEPDEAGRLATVATIFLTNRECPWRCVMCDLWRNTLPTTVPRGAIVEQIDVALRSLPPVQQVKLYNAGSFFDPGAIPPAEYAAIAERMNRFKRLVVECHPRSSARLRWNFASDWKIANSKSPWGWRPLTRGRLSGSIRE